VTLAKIIAKEKKEMADTFTKESLLALLQHHFMKKNNVSCEAVNTYIDAII
jgi:hypothetical protein